MRYCKNIANLLFCELWECLTIPIKNHNIKLQEIFMLICKQKFDFITHFFLKILQRNSKLLVTGNLGMPVHTNLKWQYQLGESFDVYMQTKNQLHPSRFSWDIAKILQTCYFGYFKHVLLCTPKMIEKFDVYLHVKNILHHSLLS